MNRSFSLWWLLPMVTLVLGGIFAFILHEPTSITPTRVASPTTPAQQELLTIQVALPPAPIVYQPILTASLHNNQVKVKSSSQQTALKQAQDTPKSNEVVLSEEQSALAKKFSQVMQEMVEEDKEPKAKERLHAQALTLYPQWYQNLVPTLEFTTHIYASEKNERWVRVNNQVVKEGELITSQMRLVSIEPQQVIIEMQKRRFTLAALSSW